MPVGPYPDFGTCMTAMQNKGYSRQAASGICGKMEQQTTAKIRSKAKTAQGPSADTMEMSMDMSMTVKDCQTMMTDCGATPQDAKDMCSLMADPQGMVSMSMDMEKPLGAATVSVDSKNNKLFVKAFLIDASLNINKWRVTPDSINKNINTFIGKPLVLTEQYDHPQPTDDNHIETLNHWLSYQETFRVGTIIDIVTKPNPVTNNPAYYAIMEVTNEDLKQSLKNNTIPVYVSPAIAELVPSATTAAVHNHQIGGDEIANWTGVHLAIVDEPAFGVKKAVIAETCGGNEEGCLLQLRKAHIAKHGVGKCGFCVTKAMQKYKILQELAINQANRPVPRLASAANTSHTSTVTANTTGKHRKMSQLENTEQSTSLSPNAANPSTQHQENVEKVEMPSTLTKAPIQHPPPSTTNLSDLAETIQKLRAENELLKIKNEELTNVKDTISERIAAIETERRRERVERIITPDIIRDDKLRLDKIKYFVSSSIPLNEIEELYKDIRVTLRKASVNQGRSMRGVPYLTGNNSIGNGVVSSTNPNNQPVTIDEETGLTPLQKQLAVLRGGP